MTMAKREWCFIRVPKTGSTSVRQALRRDWSRHHKSRSVHISAEKLAVWAPQRWEESYNFAFVRNPWDRLLSLCCARHPGVLVERARFNRWCMEKELGTGGLMQPCWTMVGIDGEIGVDFVGRYENLAKDYAHVCEQIGMSPPLQWRNKGKRKRSYRELYDDELQQKVREVYAMDIERFGYEF